MGRGRGTPDPIVAVPWLGSIFKSVDKTSRVPFDWVLRLACDWKAFVES